MLKSPEEYFSSLEFDSGDQSGTRNLSAGEKAFVEKYLGLGALEKISQTTPPVPEPIPLPQILPAAAPELPPAPATPQIIVAPPTVAVEVAQAQAPNTDAIKTETAIMAPTEEIAVEVEDAAVTVATDIKTTVPVEVITEAPVVKTAVKAPETAALEAVAVEAAVSVAAPAQEIVEAPVVDPVAPQVETVAPEVAAVDIQVAAAIAVSARDVASVAVETQVVEQTTQEVIAQPTEIVTEEVLLKEKLRHQEQVQLVSFFVAGQIFLLPVEGIQEVLRHMELIKVPSAPDFVAGAINLRGHVMPVVYLAALLSNREALYDESNFIIITGTEKMRVGLIIDKVNSMHLVPQNKFLWNPETKLAESAEFLNALVDMDDRVYGMIAPEAITRLILPELP